MIRNGQIHFISGLPRSGSTLLSAILAQNPKFITGITSPLLSLMHSVIPSMGSGEFRSFFSDMRRRQVLNGIASGYYGDAAGRVIFDTNRLWTGNLPLLKAIYSESKIICCVREPPWIIDSFERVFRQNALRTAGAVGFNVNASLVSRVDSLVQGDSSVLGAPWNALREAWYSDNSKSLIFIEYDRLVKNTTEIIEKLYELLGYEKYPHNLSAIYLDDYPYDEENGMPGLHRVRSNISPIDRETCLPPEIFAKYETPLFWRSTGGADGGGRGAIVL